MVSVKIATTLNNHSKGYMVIIVNICWFYVSQLCLQTEISDKEAIEQNPTISISSPF